METSRSEKSETTTMVQENHPSTTGSNGNNNNGDDDDDKICRSDDVMFRLSHLSPPLTPPAAITSPLPEPPPTATVIIPSDYYYEEYQRLEDRYRQSIRDLGQTKQLLRFALQTLDDCRLTISQLEGLVGSLKGVILHLDPDQGSHILNHEIAAIEATITTRGGGRGKGRGKGGKGGPKSSNPIHPPNHPRQDVHSTKSNKDQPISSIDHDKGPKNQNHNKNNDDEDAHVHRRSIASYSEPVSERHYDSTTTSTNPTKVTDEPFLLLLKKDVSLSTSSPPARTLPLRPDSRIATISHNRNPQELMIEEAVRRKNQQQQQQPIHGQLHPSSGAATTTTPTSTGSSFVSGLWDQWLSPLGMIGLSSSSMTLKGMSTDSDHGETNNDTSHHDHQSQEREGKKQEPPQGSSRNINPISHYATEQELMIQEAVKQAVKRKMEEQNQVVSSNGEESQTLSFESAYRTLMEVISYSSSSSDVEPSKVDFPRGVVHRVEQDPKINTSRSHQAQQQPKGNHNLEEGTQDAGITTISRDANEQERMLQEALRRKTTNEHRKSNGETTQMSHDDPSLRSTTVQGTIPNMERSSRMTHPQGDSVRLKQDPRIKTISHQAYMQELMIQEAVRRQQEGDLHQSTLVSGIQNKVADFIMNSFETSNQLGDKSETISPPVRDMAVVKKQDPRIITISHNPNEQELMIQQAVRRRKEEEEAEESRRLASSKGESLTKIIPPPVDVVTKTKPDPRIMTISHHPSDQELMIQQALKRKEQQHEKSTSQNVDNNKNNKKKTDGGPKSSPVIQQAPVPRKSSTLSQRI